LHFTVLACYDNLQFFLFNNVLEMVMKNDLSKMSLMRIAI
jgi:hypothetical protein